MTNSMHYRGFDILPTVERIPEGELFGGTWRVIACSIGTRSRGGYDIQYLSCDNTHFESRDAAIVWVLLAGRNAVDRASTTSRPIEYHLSR